MLDREALEEYKQFRLEAERKGFRHFLEIFDPNRPGGGRGEQGSRVHQRRHRSHSRRRHQRRPAAVPQDGLSRPAKRWRSWSTTTRTSSSASSAASAGTTYDAFKLLSEAKKYGARVALFGRKINNAENQLAFIRFLRLIADGEVGAGGSGARVSRRLAAVSASSRNGSLEDDMELQTNVMSYGGNGKVVSIPPAATAKKEKCTPIAAAAATAASATAKRRRRPTASSILRR